MKENVGFVLGADIGGSHITAAVVDIKERKLLKNSYLRKHLDTNASAKDIITSWAKVVEESIAISGKNVAKIGLALPGPFNYKKGISFIKGQGKYENLYELDVKKLLARELNMSANNIAFDNDAACFLRGEVFSGNAQNKVSLIGVTLGTGLGSAFAFDGEIKDAALWCSTFKDSIAEEYISTRWFLKRYKEVSGETARDVKHICESASQKNLEIIFAEFGNNLKDFLQIQANKYSPAEIIIGGNIAKASSYFLDKLNVLNIPVKIAALGENSALLGAASILLD